MTASNPSAKKLPYGTRLGAWMFIDAERKPLGIMVLCIVHAAKLLLGIKRNRQGKEIAFRGEMRLIREGGEVAQGIVLSLRLHELRGENKCALCHSGGDWDSAEMWGDSDNPASALMLRYLADRARSYEI